MRKIKSIQKIYDAIYPYTRCGDLQASYDYEGNAAYNKKGDEKIVTKEYKFVRRKYDGQKGTAIVNICNGGTECGLAIFRIAGPNSPYKYPSPYGDVENISCDSYENTQEMLEEGRWEIIA